MKLLSKIIKIGWYLFCGVLCFFLFAFLISTFTSKNPESGNVSVAYHVVFVIGFGLFSLGLLKFALKFRSNKKMPVHA